MPIFQVIWVNSHSKLILVDKKKCYHILSVPQFYNAFCATLTHACQLSIST